MESFQSELKALEDENKELQDQILLNAQII